MWLLAFLFITLMIFSFYWSWLPITIRLVLWLKKAFKMIIYNSWLFFWFLVCLCPRIWLFLIILFYFIIDHVLIFLKKIFNFIWQFSLWIFNNYLKFFFIDFFFKIKKNLIWIFFILKWVIGVFAGFLKNFAGFLKNYYLKNYYNFLNNNFLKEVLKFLKRDYLFIYNLFVRWFKACREFYRKKRNRFYRSIPQSWFLWIWYFRIVWFDKRRRRRWIITFIIFVKLWKMYWFPIYLWLWLELPSLAMQVWHAELIMQFIPLWLKIDLPIIIKHVCLVYWTALCVFWNFIYKLFIKQWLQDFFKEYLELYYQNFLFYYDHICFWFMQHIWPYINNYLYHLDINCVGYAAELNIDVGELIIFLLASNGYF